MNQVKDTLHSLLTACVETDDTSLLRSWLQRNPREDGLELFHDEYLIEAGITLADTFLNSDLPQRILRPGAQTSLQDRIAWALRNNLKDNIEIRLTELARSMPLPRIGSVVVFSSRLNFSICCSYQVDPRPIVEFLAISENPRSFSQVMSAASHPSQRLKLRRASLARLKISYHRGTLVAVDRYDEDEVFGPSIDTLIVCEVLAQTAAMRRSHDVIEIGSGSGAILASMVQHEPVHSILAVDRDYTSIKCTNRNVERAALIGNPASRRLYLTGSFEKDLLSAKYDLLVCNPPYLPEGTNRTLGDYGDATLGTQLLQHVLKSLPHILNPAGLALLIIPAWLLNSIGGLIPSEWHLKDALSGGTVEALFEVEAVMYNQQILDEMASLKQITHSTGFFYHRLHPVWLGRKQEYFPEPAVIQ